MFMTSACQSDSSLHYHLVVFQTGLKIPTLATRFPQKRCKGRAFFLHMQRIVNEYVTQKQSPQNPPQNSP